MRLFIAIHFSPEVKRLLLRTIESLRAQAAGGNFTREENLHLTLAFLGETINESAARAAIAAAAAPPFPLTLGGSGRFGDLWWVGVEENPALSSLASSLQNELRARGFSIERRPFKPHITVARQVVSRAPVRLEVPRVTMTADRVSLMRSARVAGELRYTELWGLDARKESL
jgi:2'-5' RNA ligase